MPPAYEPSPEEIAEIEARKEEIRRAKVAGDRGLAPLRTPPGYCTPEARAELDAIRARDAAETVRAQAGAAPQPAGDWACPQCRTPYGKRRRCFRCKPSCPGGAKARPEPVKLTVDLVPAPLRPPVPTEIEPIAPRRPLFPEIEAMGKIAAILDNMDEEAARRVVAWFADRVTAA